MNVLITWSSKTGNTASVGRAIGEIAPQGSLVCPVEEAPAAGGAYELILLGYWVDKGQPDKKCRDYLASLSGKKVGFFGTLGAWPDSDHAKECMQKTEAMAGDNEVCGNFICQGRVDPKLLEMMAKMPNNPHPMTEERKARLEEAKKHPNEEDFAAARSCFQKVFERLGAAE